MSTSLPFEAVIAPFNFHGATVLLTGGSSGIGLGLVKELVDAGSSVIITGRREDALKDVQKKYADVKYFVSDVGKEQDRVRLAADVVREYPLVNVLINNAGTQRKVALAADTAPWSERATEIEVNFAAPVHLNSMLIPHFVALNRDAAIINVSSGLAFAPMASAPIYCATKAALHSYTQSLRHSLANTNVRVVELIPPAVKSNLGGAHDFGEPTAEFCADVFKRISNGGLEVGYKLSDNLRVAGRRERDQQTKQTNEQQKPQQYKHE